MGERILTRAEAAAEFRISVRTMIEMERLHNVPVLRLGRRVLFDDDAMAVLKEAAKCPSRSNAEKTPAPFGLSAPSPPPAKSEASAFAAALALTTSPSRERKLQPLRSRSSAAPGMAKRQPRKGSV